MTVTLDGETFRFHPGARVRHLIDRLPPETQIRIRNGLAVVTDAEGNELGDGGALSPGATYHLKITL